MKIGTLTFKPAEESLRIVGNSTKQALKKLGLTGVLAANIDPSLSDTAAFCDAYEIPPEISVNCVIVEAKRADRVRYAAVMIPATKRADINGVVRKAVDAKKISFAPMEMAVKLTDMEYGAINPIGLPIDWPILVDTEAARLEKVVIGSGLRGSKLLISGNLLTRLPNAKVLDLVKT